MIREIAQGQPKTQRTPNGRRIRRGNLKSGTVHKSWEGNVDPTEKRDIRRRHS